MMSLSLCAFMGLSALKWIAVVYGILLAYCMCRCSRRSYSFVAYRGLQEERGTTIIILCGGVVVHLEHSRPRKERPYSQQYSQQAKGILLLNG